MPLLRAEGITRSFLRRDSARRRRLRGARWRDPRPGRRERGRQEHSCSRCSPAFTSPTPARSSVNGVCRSASSTAATLERYGITTIHQELTLVPELDVASNMLLARPPTRTGWRRLLRMVDREALYREAVGGARPGQRGSRSIRVLRAGSLGLSGGPAHPDRARPQPGHARVHSSTSRPQRSPLPSATSCSPGCAALRGHGVGIVYVSHRLDEVLEIS